jgi:hypothetical protein
VCKHFIINNDTTFVIYNKRWRKPKGQSSMNNPDKQTTLGTIHNMKTYKKTNKHKKMNTRTHEG